MAGSGFSRERLARLHHAMAAHVSVGDMPGIVALVSRRGEAWVEAVGTQSFGGAGGGRGKGLPPPPPPQPTGAPATPLLVQEGQP
ncbi:hypothetical protein BH10PSE6_BH10PSE6_23160 [soil metagenome]